MKPPRNKPCPCGSGRKAKWCCTIREEIAVARRRQARYAAMRENGQAALDLIAAHLGHDIAVMKRQLLGDNPQPEPEES